MGRWLAGVLLAAVLAGCAAPPADAPPVVAPGPTQALPGPAGAQADSPPDSGVSAPPRARKEGRVRSAPSSPREADTAIERGREDEEESGVLLGRGLASWYGGSLHGRRTASGERFDRGELTAAHRTLPFGARVCVRSLVNGKVVVVRVNDRGPFAPGRVIDLSQAAAQELGMVGLGIKPVEIWHMGPDDDSCPEDLPELDPSSTPAASPAVAPAGAAQARTNQGAARTTPRKSRARRR
ncbi:MULTISPECIES: septal ring lytic transglycosylase RlpA family protein [Diaphorobacter]|uniref:Endolytic peptidoglycan transglycosylase RlpA n=1 Tax=Acidovorax ebreus (strain TPSY) TaxID=535289 RepID=A0A9J9U9T5_ACIET|nr:MULTISPECIES: septal ring lytic transglycosylase RlpA family protein [Diaphorobacter]ACM32081.1 rare lipoprotein A [[Acidovorax] ebreus TPSY]